MDVEEIHNRARELGPWVNSFEYDGVVYPLAGHGSVSCSQANDLQPRRGRAQAFWDVFPHARRILELGALEGADTVRLARRQGTTVVAIEGRADNIARAEFVIDLHQLANVRLVVADVETFDFDSVAPVDAVLCTGLLYHLQQPWRLLRSVGTITDCLFLSTHYWGDTNKMAMSNGYKVKLVHEDHPETQTRALTKTVYWFDRTSLLLAIQDAGFDSLEILNEHTSDTVCDIIIACRRTRDGTASIATRPHCHAPYG